MLLLSFCAHVIEARRAYSGAEFTLDPRVEYRKASEHFDAAADIAHELDDDDWYADEFSEKADAAYELSFF